MYRSFLTARGNELDSYNHVNNAVYLNYFEQARWEVFRDTDLLGLIRDKGLLLVVTEVRVKYIREVCLFDHLEIQTRVSKQAPFLVFSQRIFNADSGQSVAKGETKTLFINKDREPLDIPAQVIKAFNL
jgi:YbgC/YbaW family acyl-CoA thioester hydrolase